MVEDMEVVTVTQQEKYDVVIVGGGAAGLNGALLLGRSRRKVLVVDAGQPRNEPAAHLRGYLSRDGMPPAELLSIGRSEVRGYGVEIRTGTVTTIERGVGGFCLELDDGATVCARSVLVTTGLGDELPDLPGIRERWGRDVVHCPYCHGYEVRDQAIGVLATGPLATHQALLVRQLSADVTLFTHTADVSTEDREKLDARGIRIMAGEVAALEINDDRLTGVRLVSGEIVPREAVFVGPYFQAHDSLLATLGAEIVTSPIASRVRTDETGQTTVPGVWAAGNVADPSAQLITAAAGGAKAAAAINAHLVEDDVQRALRAPAPREVFTAKVEAALCEQVLAERRHGV